MICFFKIEVTDSELLNIFQHGSTNQQDLANDIIKFNVFDEFFNTLEEIQEFNKFDIREAINGGVLKIIEYEPEDLEETAPEDINLKDNIFLHIE